MRVDVGLAILRAGEALARDRADGMRQGPDAGGMDTRTIQGGLGVLTRFMRRRS